MTAERADIAAKHDALKRDNISLLAKYEGSLKDVAAAREEAALVKENLARALGYIDRINDQERPPSQPYVPPASPQSNSGPVMQSLAKDQFGRRY